MSNDMKLPKGKTAKDRHFFYKCSKIFGRRSNNTECDFSPSRFVLKGRNS